MPILFRFHKNVWTWLFKFFWSTGTGKGWASNTPYSLWHLQTEPLAVDKETPTLNGEGEGQWREDSKTDRQRWNVWVGFYSTLILVIVNNTRHFPTEGTHIKLVFTTNPLPVQNKGNSLRHSATARLVRRVQGTRYNNAGWPISIRARATNVMRRPMP